MKLQQNQIDSERFGFVRKSNQCLVLGVVLMNFVVGDIAYEICSKQTVMH
jgi:hypothetical protein